MLSSGVSFVRAVMFLQAFHWILRYTYVKAFILQGLMYVDKKDHK
ncbi:hypothetical protein A33Q_0924 [Indibacter alkaliphilus LW1]|uniref:Uncharacterized protein n=1 Tax=Indibacter alkaliphilus (strain CCUG 57479 / KCTC 22604 / LW1) TaxID=1189612 RepID=S2DM45_INDAL|nr:hypothetical protein A33Q_0924 [Indibacter alkaliphilus LW1]